MTEFDWGLICGGLFSFVLVGLEIRTRRKPDRSTEQWMRNRL